MGVSLRVLYCVVDTGYGLDRTLGDCRPALKEDLFTLDQPTVIVSNGKDLTLTMCFFTDLKVKINMV